MTFYDEKGDPIAYCDDGESIYTFSGEPVAYIYTNAVYGYNGKQFGWFEDGWVRDLNGDCVFFTEDATGLGPIKPIKSLKPLKSLKSIRPIKAIREIKALKPLKSLSWSPLSGVQFFMQ